MKNKTFPTRLMLLLAVSTLVIASCSDDTTELDAETSVAPKAEVPVDQDAEFITKYFMGDAVQVQLEEDGTYSLAGTDTRLFEEQLADSPDSYNPNPVPGEELSGLALAGGIRKWPENTVYYVINGLSSSVRSELQKSFDEWSNKTNVRFKERTNQSNYVTISSSGSNSNSGVATLGMYNSRGYIRLGTRATAVVIIHELGHTLGYIHEQNRADRDDHIIIRTENIQSNAQDQFYKSTSATFLTGSFDVNSIMMYGSYTFSKNGQPTITDLNGNTLPQRQARLSTLDIQGTNAAYPSSGGGGGNPQPEEDLCDTTADYASSKSYRVGDYVLYYGRLYQRDYTRWNYIKRCS
ncbi:M12 family metallopeptidase [Zobellia russellii]|uniref:M12 family metallopeptidase n=1 Tax=Zobellia russellii TaxID=248907 RepID=UPI0037DDD0B5